ncbi:MAG: hypothetical protein ACREM3_24410 [Candidatus Rokuibacteriota bacterium]
MMVAVALVVLVAVLALFAPALARRTTAEPPPPAAGVEQSRRGFEDRAMPAPVRGQLAPDTRPTPGREMLFLLLLDLYRARTAAGTGSR